MSMDMFEAMETYIRETQALLDEWAELEELERREEANRYRGTLDLEQEPDPWELTR